MAQVVVSKGCATGAVTAWNAVCCCCLVLYRCGRRSATLGVGWFCFVVVGVPLATLGADRGFGVLATLGVGCGLGLSLGVLLGAKGDGVTCCAPFCVFVCASQLLCWKISESCFRAWSVAVLIGGSGLAAVGFFNVSMSSVAARTAASADEVFGIVVFTGKNSTVSLILSALVLLV